MPSNLENLFTVRSRHHQATVDYLDGLCHAVTIPNPLLKLLFRGLNNDIRIPLRATEAFQGRANVSPIPDFDPKNAELEYLSSEDPSEQDYASRKQGFEFKRPTPNAKALNSLIHHHPKAVILGPPGSGKTEWLRAETHRRIEECRRMDEPGLWRLPAFVRLQSASKRFRGLDLPNAAKDFGIKLNHTVTLAELFALSALISIFDDHPKLNNFRLLIAPQIWNSWFEKAHENRAFLALDGYDESLPNNTGEFSNALNKFVETTQADLIIATRAIPGIEYALGSESEIKYFEIAPITEDQRDGLITHLLGDEKSNVLQRAVANSPALDRLTLNPLLATLMCLVVASTSMDRKIPVTRSELFKRATFLLMTRWRNIRAAEVPTPEKKASIDAKVSFIQQLSANLLFSENPDAIGSIDASIARAFGDEFLQNSKNLSTLRRDQIESGEDLIDSLVADGILSLTDDKNGFSTEVRFIHQTFFEFNLAGFFAEMLNSSVRKSESPLSRNQNFLCALDRLSWSPEFRELIILTASQLNDPSPLLRRLMDPRTDDIYGTRTDLAVACVCEMSEEKRDACRSAINKLIVRMFSGENLEHARELVGANPTFQGISLQEYLANQLDIRRSWCRKAVPLERAIKIAELSGPTNRLGARIVDRLNEIAAFACGRPMNQAIGHCGYIPLYPSRIDTETFFSALKASYLINQEDNLELKRILLHKLKASKRGGFVQLRLLRLLASSKIDFFASDDLPTKRLLAFLERLVEEFATADETFGAWGVCDVLAAGAPYTASQKIVRQSFALLRTSRDLDDWRKKFLFGNNVVKSLVAGGGNEEVVDRLLDQIADAPYSVSFDIEGALQRRDQALRVIDMLSSEEERLREAAARLIIASGEVEDAEVLQRLISAVEGLVVPRTVKNFVQGVWVDEQSRESLGFDAFSRDLMTRGLRSQEAGVLCGAEIVRRIGSSLFHPRLHEELLDLIEDPRWELRAAAFHALAALGPRSGCKRLAEAALGRVIAFGFTESVSEEEFFAAQCALGETCSESLAPAVSEALLRLLELGHPAFRFRILSTLSHFSDVGFSVRFREAVWQAIDEIEEDELYALVWTTMGKLPSSLWKVDIMLRHLLSGLYRFAASGQFNEYRHTVSTICDIGHLAGNCESLVEYFLTNCLKGDKDECWKFGAKRSSLVLEKILKDSTNERLLERFFHHYDCSLGGILIPAIGTESDHSDHSDRSDRTIMQQNELGDIMLAFSPRSYSAVFLEKLVRGFASSRDRSDYPIKILRKAGSEFNSLIISLASDKSLSEAVRRQIVDLLPDRGFRVFSERSWHQKLEPIQMSLVAIAILSPVALTIVSVFVKSFFPEFLMWCRNYFDVSTLSPALMGGAFGFLAFCLAISVASSISKLCTSSRWRIEPIERLSRLQD